MPDAGMEIHVQFSFPDRGGLVRDGRPVRRYYLLSHCAGLEAVRAVRAAGGDRAALAFLGGGVPSGVLEGLSTEQANDLVSAWETWAGILEEGNRK